MVDAIINPATGRCVKKTGKIGRMLIDSGIRPAPCKDDVIINPTTGRIVAKTGKIGQTLSRRGRQVPCKEDEIRNPSTDRCVKRTGKIGQKILGRGRNPPTEKEKELDPKYIYNPDTDKYVLKASETGKKILSKLAKDAKELELPDTEDISVKNILPTNRRTKPRDYMSRQQVENAFGTGIFDIIPSGYRIVRRIGDDSVYGSVWLLCDYSRTFRNCNLVMKIQPFYVDKKALWERYNSKTRTDTWEQYYDLMREAMWREFQIRSMQEAKTQKEFAKHDLSPRVLIKRFYTHGDIEYFVMIMDRIDMSVSEFIQSYSRGRDVESVCQVIVDGIAKLIQDMCKYRLIHGDMHIGNVGMVFLLNEKKDDEEYKEGDEKDDAPVEPIIRFFLIDFGWSSVGNDKVQCAPRLEFLQFLRTVMDEDHNNFKNKKLQKCLTKNIFELYKSIFTNDPLPLRYEDVDREYKKEHRRYAENYFFKLIQIA